MKKTLLLFLLFFIFLYAATSLAQESESEEIQPLLNPGFTQTLPQSIFDDPQPIYGSDWEWLHQSPNGNTLRWVKMWDQNNWYAAGYGGTFMKTTDAGANWFVSKTVNGLDATGGNEIIYDAHFWDMNTGIVVGGYGKCWGTTDGGLTWDSLSSFPTAATCYDMYFVDDTLGFAVGTTSMRIYKTIDGGNNWVQIWGDLPSLTCYSVYASDENNIIIGSSSGNLRVTTNGGVNWTIVNVGFSSTLYSLKFTDPMNGWVAGSSSHAAYTTDGGATWTDVSTGLPASTTFYDVDVVNPVARGLTLATVYPQSTNYWTGSTDGTTKTELSEVKGIDTEDGWFMFDISSIPDAATIDSIRFYGYVNYTYYPYWSATPLPGLDPLTATATDLKTAIQANSGSGVAYVYANESSTFSTGWHNYLMGNTANADLQAALAQDWFAMGMDSRDNDSTYYINWDGWAQTNVGYLEVYYTLPAQPAVYLTGNLYDITYTTDMGTTWNLMSILDPSQPWTSTFYSTDFESADHFVTVGAFGMINEVTQPSDAAIAHTLWVKAGILYDVWVQRADSRVVAVGAPGNTTSNDQGMFSTDGGDTWASGVTTPGTDLDFNSLSMVDSLLGYACGEDHIVYKTTDGGATWNAVTQPATSTTDLEEIFFVDANTGYTFGGTGLGYKTTDGGTSWTPLTTTITGTIYGSYFLDDMTGFIVGASGNARKTTDGGTTFTSLTPSVGTSTIYSIWMVDNNVGYLSCASEKVRKTTDGGITWDTVDVGSSTTTLYDIEFKNEGNGMTGGSIGKTWYTTDGGTTWNFENTSMSTVYGVAIDHSSQDTAAAYVCGTNAYVMRNSHVIVPVELTTFTASVNGNNVTLSWQTATEINNSGFKVERRSDEQNWNEIGFVQGHGTTTEIQEYSFTDKNLPVGSYNYRIKQIDYDGSYEYFNLPNAVEVAAPESYDLSQNYPNPFNPATKIKYAVPVDGLVTLSVYNVLGEKVADLVNNVQKAGIYEVTFNASNLASGVYIYRMEAADFVSIKKMMILK